MVTLSEEEDKLLMEQQDKVYGLVKDFLQSDLAIRGMITGVNIYVKDGYVDAMWDCGERHNNDIIE